MITIIICTLNEEKNIKKCLNSLLSQKNKNFRIIIVDANSNDNTVEIIKKFKKKLSIKIIIKDKMGFYSSLNYAIKFVRTKYYLVMGADDLLYKNAIQYFYNICYKKISYDFISYKVKTQKKTLSASGNQHRSGHLAYVSGHSVSLLIKTNLHRKFGFYSLKFKYAADVNFILRVALANSKIYIGKNIVGFYNLYGMSNSLRSFFEYSVIQLKYSKNVYFTIFFLFIKFLLKITRFH